MTYTDARFYLLLILLLIGARSTYSADKSSLAKSYKYDTLRSKY